MKTMKVNLNVLQSVTSQHSIVETDTQFQLPVSLGGGATLVLTCPKELPAEGPGLPIDPFSCVADVRGCLDEFFAGIEPAAEGEPVFQMPVVSAQLGDLYSGERGDSRPVRSLRQPVRRCSARPDQSPVGLE